MSCYQDPHKKYINGGHYGLNGSITNGHLPHHSYHSQHYQHNSSQSSPKSYTVTDVMDGYTSASAPSKSPPMYPSDIGSDVYEDMYNHLSVGDTNCNSIDQSKSPQIMQVKHSGSNNNHRSANCLKLETLNTTDSLTVLEHMLPSHKSGHLLSSSNGITQICGSYEKVPNAINNSLFHNQHNSMEMVPNTSEHSQPCDNFLVMDSSSKYTHNPPKSKKKRRRQYVHEHSTRDQATNTDLSSNEGTLEFAPLKKSMSLSDKELPSSAYNLSNSKTAMPTLNTETAILEENTC